MKNTTLKIILDDDTCITAVGVPTSFLTDEMVHEGPEQYARIKTLVSWFNEAGEKVAQCWLERMKGWGTADTLNQ